MAISPISANSSINNFQMRQDKNVNNDLSGKQEKECQTCKNRKYKDGSDDPGVSFKTASKIKGNPESAVRRHENEHVVRNKAKAEREDKEIISQTVTLKSDICPECGKVYVSGGETRTVTKDKPEDKFKVGTDDGKKSGSLLNASV